MLPRQVERATDSEQQYILVFAPSNPPFHPWGGEDRGLKAQKIGKSATRRMKNGRQSNHLRKIYLTLHQQSQVGLWKQSHLCGCCPANG